MTPCGRRRPSVVAVSRFPAALRRGGGVWIVRQVKRPVRTWQVRQDDTIQPKRKLKQTERTCHNCGQSSAEVARMLADMMVSHLGGRCFRRNLAEK